MFGLKSGKSSKISLPCLSLFGITDDVFEALVVDLPADGVSFGLLSLTTTFRFFFGDPSLDIEDEARLGAIVDFNGDFGKTQSKTLEL